LVLRETPISAQHQTAAACADPAGPRRRHPAPAVSLPIRNMNPVPGGRLLGG